MKATTALWGLACAAGFYACRPSAPPPDDAPPKATSQPAGTERPQTLVFGLTPYLPDDELRREYGPLVEYLGQQVGLPTRMRVAKSYAELAQLLARREVQVAVLSPFNYVRTQEQHPDLALLATQIAEGASTYAAYIVVRADSRIESLEELQGKRFGFVDRQSTSGYLYPLAYLRSLGHQPEAWFGSVLFAGNHTRVVDKVLSGEIDAGAIFATAYKRAGEGRLKILAKTGRIPYDAYCAAASLDAALVERLRLALLALSTRTEEGRRILTGLTNINGFVAVTDAHYDEVRRVARLVAEATP